MSISANIESAKTIRDYLGSLNDPTKTVTVVGDGNIDLDNVDLTWDGQNYYILGTTTDAQGVTTTKVYKLDSILPLTITIASKTE